MGPLQDRRTKSAGLGHTEGGHTPQNPSHKRLGDHPDTLQTYNKIAPDTSQSGVPVQAFHRVRNVAPWASNMQLLNRKIKSQESLRVNGVTNIAHYGENRDQLIDIRAVHARPSNQFPSRRKPYIARPTSNLQDRSKTQKMPKDDSNVNLFRPREDEATASHYMAENGLVYWGSIVPDHSLPWYPVIRGYMNLIVFINALLDGPLFGYKTLKFYLRDTKHQIHFMREKMIRCSFDLRQIPKLVQHSQMIQDLHCDQRLQKQRAFDLHVHQYRKLAPVRSFMESQREIFACHIELMGFRKNRDMTISPRMYNISRLCKTLSATLEGLPDYIRLANARYLHCHSGEDLVDPWLAVSIALSHNQALFFKLEQLSKYWRTSGIADHMGFPRHGSARKAFVHMKREMRECIRDLKPGLSWFRQMLINQWASRSPNDTAGDAPQEDPADKDELSNERSQKSKRRDENIKDSNRSPDRGISLEHAQLDVLAGSSSSDLTLGLNICPTQKLAQEYISSPLQVVPSTSNEIWTNFAVMPEASVKSSALGLDGDVSNLSHSVDAMDNPLDVHVGSTAPSVTEEPFQRHQSPLGYRIPDIKLLEARSVPPGTTASYWQYLLYRGPNGEKIKVHYCKSKATTERIAQLFLNQEVVGFDIEWKPQALAIEGVKKNVALIQLATEERIALFHIARYWEDENHDDLLAPTLRKIMESSATTKVGVSIKADFTRLRKFMGVDARGLFELSHLYKLVKFAPENIKLVNKRLVSLSQQVEEHLQLPMWKGEVRSSDWSQELNYEQIYCEYI